MAPVINRHEEAARALKVVSFVRHLDALFARMGLSVGVPTSEFEAAQVRRDAVIVTQALGRLTNDEWNTLAALAHENPPSPITRGLIIDHYTRVQRAPVLSDPFANIA